MTKLTLQDPFLKEVDMSENSYVIIFLSVSQDCHNFLTHYLLNFLHFAALAQTILGCKKYVFTHLPINQGIKEDNSSNDFCPKSALYSKITACLLTSTVNGFYDLIYLQNISCGKDKFAAKFYSKWDNCLCF
jgi:hypothetical protein